MNTAEVSQTKSTFITANNKKYSVFHKFSMFPKTSCMVLASTSPVVNGVP